MAFEATIDNNKLSIHADQVKLQTILRELAKKEDLKIRIDPKLNPLISANFDGRALQEGLKRILSPLNYILQWESNSSHDKNHVRLAEIHIFKQGMKHLAAPLKRSFNLNITRNPEDGSLYIKGELLIRLKPGVDMAYLNRIIHQAGGELIATNTVLGFYRIKVPDQTDVPALISALKKCNEIELAEPNYAFPISLPHRYLINADLLTDGTYNLPRDGVAPIAVLDSGLTWNNDLNERVVATWDALNRDTLISDPVGHGTQMALVAAGIVPPFGVETNNKGGNPVIAVRAFDENGYTSSVALIDGIHFAMANNARVMSLSWGSETKSDFIKEALGYAASKGLFIVAAAGNEPSGILTYPAAYESVIGVGALAPNGKKWKNSNYGDFVDIYTPGFANMPVGYNSDPGIYAGTSISTAYLANQIATFLSQQPNASKDEILEELMKNSNIKIAP